MRLILLTILFFTGLTVNAQSNNATANKKGVASYYHDRFEGRKTATGEVFDNDKFTAACNTLKLGTYVKVTNVSNGKVVYVRINDRMAQSNPRLIDLASIAAEKLDFISNGLTKVKIEIVPAHEGKNRIYAQKGIGAPVPFLGNQL